MYYSRVLREDPPPPKGPVDGVLNAQKASGFPKAAQLLLLLLMMMMIMIIDIQNIINDNNDKRNENTNS